MWMRREYFVWGSVKYNIYEMRKVGVSTVRILFPGITGDVINKTYSCYLDV